MHEEIRPYSTGLIFGSLWLFGARTTLAHVNNTSRQALAREREFVCRQVRIALVNRFFHDNKRDLLTGCNQHAVRGVGRHAHHIARPKIDFHAAIQGGAVDLSRRDSLVPYRRAAYDLGGFSRNDVENLRIIDVGFRLSVAFAVNDLDSVAAIGSNVLVGNFSAFILGDSFCSKPLSSSLFQKANPVGLAAKTGVNNKTKTSFFMYTLLLAGAADQLERSNTWQRGL